MNTPEEQSTIYAQAYAIAMMHKRIMDLEIDHGRIWNERCDLVNKLDAERDQHGKTKQCALEKESFIDRLQHRIAELEDIRLALGKRHCMRFQGPQCACSHP